MLLAAFVVFNIHPAISLPVWAFFLLIDTAYLSANLFKFLTGEPGTPLFTAPAWFIVTMSQVLQIHTQERAMRSTQEPASVHLSRHHTILEIAG